jgi:hypothetical protein
MFALLAAGRLVQTNFVQVEQNKYITMLGNDDSLFPIVTHETIAYFPEGANTVNHLV